MNKTVYRLSLDMQSNVCQRELNMRKKESGRQIVATIRDGSTHYHITDDCRAVFAARKPDGNILFNGCVIKGCDVVYDVTEQTTLVPGVTECEFRIYGGDGLLVTSPKFAINVIDTVYDDEDEIESTSEFSALTSALTEANLLIEEVKNLGNDIDPEAIAEAVAEYLDANPIRETDPTVPDWVKPIAAEIGQYFRVSAVDENGNVSAVEAVDAPSGGGGESCSGLKLVARITTEEDSAAIFLTGLSAKLPISMRLYNAGVNTGNGVCISLNGVTSVSYTGTQTGTSETAAKCRGWIFEKDGETISAMVLSNSGGFGAITPYNTWNFVPDVVESFEISSWYHADGTKYYQAGTILEIYEGVYPNVD